MPAILILALVAAFAIPRFAQAARPHRNSADTAARLTLLTYDAPVPSGAVNLMRVHLNGSEIELVDGHDGTVLTSQPFDHTSAVVINGSAGDDTLVVDFRNGNPVPAGGLTFNGGEQVTSVGDAIVIQGGSFQTAVYDYYNAHDGRISLDGSVINYTGLEPLSSTGTVVNIVFNLPAGTVGASLQDDGIPDNNTSQLASTNGAFETTTFTVPTSSLTIDAGGGTDTITTAANFSGDFNAALTINGTAASDTVTLNALTLGNSGANPGTLIVTANTINVNGAINTSAGTAPNITLTANGAVTTNGSSVTATNLGITAGGGIGASTPLATQVSNLDFNNSAGAVRINNTGGLTIANVANMGNAVNSGTTTTLAAGSPITFAVNTTSAGTLTATASETTPPTPSFDNVTVNSGVTVQSTGGDVLFLAGDDIIVNTMAVVQAPNGNIDFRTGFGDNDNEGVMTLNGTVAANASTGTVALNVNSTNTALTPGTNIITEGATGSVTGAGLLLLNFPAGAPGPISLDASTNNQVGTIAATTQAGVNYRNNSALTVGAVTSPNEGVTSFGIFTTNHDVTLSSVSAPLTLDQAINAGVTATTRLSSGGAITQTGTGKITAANLGMLAAGSADLSVANPVNHVTGTFAASDSASGAAIVFKDDSGFNVGTVTAAAPSFAGASGVTTNNGDININAGGSLTMTQNVNAGSGTISLSSATGAFSEGLFTGTLTGTAITFTDGSSTGHTWTVTPTSVTDAPGTAIPYSNAINLTINASTGNDTFNVTPSTTTTFHLNGDSPATAPGDTLDVDTTGATNVLLTRSNPGGPSHDGRYTFSNRQTVFFTSIETLTNTGVPTAASSSISGLVTTSDGKPLGGVVIELGGAKRVRVITDSSGRYQINGIDTGSLYTLTPLRANYVFNPAIRSFSLLADRTDEVFTATAVAETANPLDTVMYFVRQHYLDFLGREPDQKGLEYWTAQIEACRGDAQCPVSRETGVSAAFFTSEEFQQTGGYIYRLYKGALGRELSYAEFTADRSRVIGGETLEQSKTAFADTFVRRAEFMQKYGQATSTDSFVAALIQTMQQSAGVDLGDQHDALVATYNTGKDMTESQSLTVRAAIEAGAFKRAVYNPSFVLMQYFGYLRRDPDRGGYEFWLNVLNSRDPNNYPGMVCAFITSAEYQRRFSPVVTHTNVDCGRAR